MASGRALMAEAASPKITELLVARPALDRTSTVTRVADLLRERITDGRLPPGTQLAEHPVADALGVSRNTLREAFRLLGHERLLSHEQHRGVFVRTLNEADVVDIYATRRIVEDAAVRHAEGASTAARAELRAAVTTALRAAADGQWHDVGTADLRFHSAITALAGSRHVDELMRRMLAELRLAFHVMGDPRRLYEPYVHRNAAITSCIEQGRLAEAAAELRSYLDDAERQILGGMREERP